MYIYSLFAVDSMASVSYRNLIPEPVSVKTKKLLRSNEIIFKKNPLLRKEGFKLEVTEDNMVIEAADLAGAFYAVQMLRQLSLPTAAGETLYRLVGFSPSESFSLASDRRPGMADRDKKISEADRFECMDYGAAVYFRIRLFGWGTI